MEYSRSELMPGVFLSHLRSDKFKTACMSVNLLTQLRRETAAMNALLPAVLRRGTTRYPDMEQLSGRLDELYGAAIEPVIRRVGEVHCFGFFASFPEPAFLPGGEALLGEMSALMAEMLLSPNTRGGFGDVETAEAIHYKKLSRYYRELLRTCPVELFYCGRAKLSEVEETLRDAFSGLPRGEIDYDIGTEIRMNAIEAAPRYYEERMDVTQGKLVLGFRLGECMEEPDRAAIHVFNALYGSGATSKLFLNVREKLSLCYYASSAIVLRKGLMIVSSGISFENFEPAKTEILAQLDKVRNGEITDEELTWARRAVASDLRAALDSQGDLEGYWLSQAIDGLDYGPTELAELAENVTKEDVMKVARSIELDLVYFLCGEDGEETDEEEETEDDNTQA